MELVMEQLDIHSTSDAFEDYLERFEIWSMTRKDVKDDKIVAHFLTFIGKEAYSLLKTLAYPEKPISLPYAMLKELLLNHVKCPGFECRERAKFHKMIRQNDQNVKEFILELQKQAVKCSDSRVKMNGVSKKNYKGNQKGETKFGKCLSCGKLHSRYYCTFRNAKCFRCGKIGHIQAVCKATVHFASSSTKACNLDPNNSVDPNDHLSLSTISKVHKTLNDLCTKSVIEPVQSSAWGTPIVTPLKSDDKTHRICGDYRLTLNSRLLKQTCTTVEAEDFLNRLHGSKVFSKVDLKDAYLQIPLDQSSSILTTINTPFGLFKYNFLPFGLSCSPAIFQEVMNKVVSDLEGVEVYQDDLIVHGADKGVHDQRLIALLRRLIEKNITVNPNKCSFSVSSFECLGYLVDGNGFRPDMKRLAPLTNAPSPKNLTELRSLVGALQYYSRFIPNFSCRANCLSNILTSNSFKWGEEQESCLRSLLKFLQSDAVFRTYSPSVQSVLITDASPVGIGAVFKQEGRPVICVSRKLTVTEQGYSQTKREALAVSWAVKRLHKYLFGKKFTIVTDHEALQFIYHPEKSLARASAAMVQRWSIAFSTYDYTVQHRSAKQIQHVDYISRQLFFGATFTSETSRSH
ncbi:unnamed protein product [Schistosoma turkestanicum]|nr:unnamed protein product [Schistosoma turkestanicum]